jgi:predicted nucleotidyltransferase
MEITTINELENYFRKTHLFDLLGVSKIGVFGSFAREEKFNDIDLLIENNVSLESLVSFRSMLKRDIQVPVDIVLSKYAEPIILFRARQDLKYATRFSIIKNDLPQLVLQISNCIREQISNKVFNSDELEISKGSIFYQHINFSLLH